MILFDSHKSNQNKHPPWHPTAKVRRDKSATLAPATGAPRPSPSRPDRAGTRCHRPHRKTTLSSLRATPTLTSKYNVALSIELDEMTHHVHLSTVSTMIQMDEKRKFSLRRRKRSCMRPQTHILRSLCCISSTTQTQASSRSPRHRGKTFRPRVPFPPIGRFDVPPEH